MARSTKKSLAGKAASAAKRIVGTRGGGKESTTAKKAAAKKTTTAKKAAAKKTTTAKKAAAKKTTTAKKAAAKKTTTAKKAAAKKTTTAKKAAAKKTTTAKKAAAKKTTTAKKAAAKKTTTAKKAAAKKTTTAKKATAKKATAKKAAPETLVVGKGEDKWSKKQLAAVLAELNEQRAHSLEIMDGQQTELTAMLRDAGDGAGQDQADVGATSFERDHEITVLNTERDKLFQIDRALERIANGSYGVCERCGNPIGKMRLMAFPRATLCLTCKQREERR